MVPKLDDGMHLLYRLSRDGLPLSRFHEMCDGDGPTLTLIKSNYGKTFGGYTDISWQMMGAGQKGNGKTFIFSIQED